MGLCKIDIIKDEVIKLTRSEALKILDDFFVQFEDDYTKANKIVVERMLEHSKELRKRESNVRT